jgi:hypothetical protein
MNQPALPPWGAKDFKIDHYVIRFMKDSVDREFVDAVDELDRAVQTFVGAVRDDTSRDHQMETARKAVIGFRQLIKLSTPSTHGLRAWPVPLRVTMEVAHALMQCFVAKLSPKDGHRFSDDTSQEALGFYRAYADHDRTERAIWDLKFYDWARLKNLITEDRRQRWEGERTVTFSRDELDEFFRRYELRILQNLLNCERISYDRFNSRMALSDPLHDNQKRELIAAWTLQPHEIKRVDENVSSGAAT